MRTIFCIIFSLFYGASSKTINVATNGKVTLQSHVEGEIENIVWMHDGDKMVDWDNKAVNIREYFKFKGRIKLDVKTGDVTFIRLTKDDSGLYEAVVIIQGRIISIKHRVKVTDPVTEAKVTCLSNATLHCEAEGDSLDYSWFGPGLQTAEMRGQTGPQISKENQDSVYTCVVNNPVSHSSVTYHASGCFASDPVTEAKVICLSNATLHCEAEGDSLDYSWSGPGLQTAEMRGQTGPQISKENQDSVYTCVVNNTVSHSSVTYHVRDCFASDAGDHQLILRVVSAVIGVIGVICIGAAGLVYYCYKINSRGQKHTGNENKRETTEKIIPNQKEETVVLLPGRHQASFWNSVDGEPTGGDQDKINRITVSQATPTEATYTCDGFSVPEAATTLRSNIHMSRYNKAFLLRQKRNKEDQEKATST
ncbi:uncharacterized protein LOC116221545 isoform X2 [Clupea harengus]|uniref:Uncharacterized protein LOC116221545 isoform X2 n=1 Tax=Clupea harengus TaxID=7950 RepID=A0A6P8FQ88_CLUHA|nr:uncharacterized protein LOC116221545 isoform X3 [Clupea harengus]XP_042564548.1 uncharacterized protein LOC116221545 isoform X2 [Clupea harengus]